MGVHVLVSRGLGLSLPDQALDRLLKVSRLLRLLLFLFFLLLLLKILPEIARRHALLRVIAVVLELLVLLFVRHQRREGIHGRSKSILAFIVLHLMVLKCGYGVAGVALACLGALRFLLAIRENLPDLLLHQCLVLWS